ncbi:DNA repair protein rad50 [Mortierella sp. AD011]|nr:DNA repair protein rad50 [Mortierella sp. AD010]KAF9403666.1 DNA repair protein rad50 [Mortierella sp. AD011]
MGSTLPIPRFEPLVDIEGAITSVLTITKGQDTTPAPPTKNTPVATNPFKNRPTAFDDPINSILVPKLDKYRNLERAADRATLLETAFKLKLIIKQNELGTRIHDLRDAMFQCLDLLLRCSELDLLDHTTPLNCIEEVLELQTVECSEHIYNYLESRVERLTVHMVAGKGKGLTLLRLCNELLRRLSKAKNTVFCGRILMLLASVFPLTERSGVNLRGEFNTENVTLVENEETIIVPDLALTSQQSQKEIDAHVPGVETMDLDEEDKGQQLEKKQDNTSQDDSAFYTEFWSLQSFFCNPTVLVNSAENMSKLRSGIDHALDKFVAVEEAENKARGQMADAESTDDSKPTDSSSIKHGNSVLTKRKHPHIKDKIAEPAIYFPKFLTSPKLLRLEYLENHNSSAKEAYAKIVNPNKSFQPNWILEETDQEWITSVKPRIYKQLKVTGVESGDNGFMNAVNAVLGHEESWIQWKVESCQSFERPSLTDADLEETQAKRQKLSKGLDAFRQPLGCQTLSDLWSQAQPEGAAVGSNRLPPSLSSYMKAVHGTGAKLPPGKFAQSEQEMKDLEQARLWKALRLGAQQYMHLYGKLITAKEYSLATLEADVSADGRGKTEIKNGATVTLSNVVDPSSATPATEASEPNDSEKPRMEDGSSETQDDSPSVGGDIEMMDVDAELDKKENMKDQSNNPIILIRGVRSFESESGEAATITFYSPLTLITGHNGSGKTTVIECLKYATTGFLPPGTKGGAFVNDPKMSDSPSVKAQVRLRFRNVNSQIMSITRSLSVTVKKNTYTQKTLENVLAAVDPQTGELATISAKCAELDADVPNHLGVSRAILDNVIFCHQEESNWPLSEPSILKKRFDDIFASTKYTNVLDSIKTIRKEKAQDLKIMHASLEFIRRNKEKAEKASIADDRSSILSLYYDIFKIQIRESLAKNIQSLETGQKRIEQLDIDIKECGDEIGRLMEMTKDLQAIDATLSALSHEHRATLANIRELDGSFTVYTEPDSVLQEMLFKHELSLKTADQEKVKQERLKQQASSSIANLQTSVNSNQQSIGQLKAQLDSNKKKQNDRDQLIREIAIQYSFEGFDALPLVNSDVSRFIKKLESHVQQKIDDVEKVKAENRKKEQDIRAQIADRKARIDMSSSLKSKIQKSISSAKAKLRQQNEELLKYQSTEDDVGVIEKQLADQETSLTALKSGDPSPDHLESQKRAKMADIEAFENDLSRLSDRSSEQIKNAGSQAKLALLRDSCSQRSEEIQRIMETHHDMFLLALKKDPVPDIVESQLVSVLEEKEAAVQTSRNILEQLKQEVSSYDIRIGDAKAKLQKHEIVLADYEKNIVAVCGEDPLPELLATREEAIAELREQIQDMKTMSTMYERFVAMAEKKHACPLCSRGFDPALEAQFAAKLRRLMDKAENDDERELIALEANIATLRPLKSAWDSAIHLRSTEIPALKKQISDLEVKLVAATKSLESADVEAAGLAASLQDLRQLAAVAKNVTQLCRENIKGNSQIMELETELLITGSTQSVEELQEEYSAVKMKVQSARHDLTRLQQQIAQVTADIQRKEEVIQSLKEKRNRLLNEQSHQSQISEQIAETNSIIQSLSAELEQHEIESQSIIPELNSLNEILKQLTTDAQAGEGETQQVVSEMQKSLEKVRMYNDDLERLDTRSAMTQLSKLEADTDTYFDEIQRHTDALRAAEKSMQSLQEQLTGFKNLQRSIDDNLRHRRYVAKAQELEAKISGAKSKKNGKAQETYSLRLNRLSQRQSNLTSEKAGLKGEIRQLQDQKLQYEDELNGEYKDVVRKYHDNLIGYKTTELALQDLEKYAKALQSAIVEYHSMKMEEINKSIKELWTNTYRGTDIDSIEIRSDQEGLRANQSYNYRVVMIQKGRAMDMRGRCSAGQKVLASIIIRLALAESFSLNCGILALDEPTTNLDEANVSQLAQSLRSIIDKHREQSNFQLIVITHDENFLRMLNLTDYVDYYYRVQKNSEQYSSIRRLPVTDS